jgi:hypothetical protein
VEGVKEKDVDRLVLRGVRRLLESAMEEELVGAASGWLTTRWAQPIATGIGPGGC